MQTRARNVAPIRTTTPLRSAIHPPTAAASSRIKQYSLLHFFKLKVSHAFLYYIAYEIVYKRNTNSYFSLSVESDTQGQRKIGGQGREGRLFLFVFLFLLECALLTRSSKEGKSQPDRQTEKERERESREAGQAAGKHTEQETLASSPTSARAANKQLSPVLGTDTTQGDVGIEAIL